MNQQDLFYLTFSGLSFYAGVSRLRRGRTELAWIYFLCGLGMLIGTLIAMHS